MTYDSKSIFVRKVLPVPDRQDVALALDAGFTKEEVAFMLDLPENLFVAVDISDKDERQAG